MIKSRQQLEAELNAFIYARDIGLVLSTEIRGRMAQGLANFVVDATDKFIKGQQEHGGNLHDRDLDKEIRAETIDLFWYNTAKQWKDKIV